MDILIAEDERSTISDLKAILGELGHKVVAVVSGGEEAVQYAGDLNPDLVLINIRLIDAAGQSRSSTTFR